MRHLGELKVHWLLIGYAGALFLLTATLILLDAPESILILAAIPVVLAATRYPRWAYLVMLNLLIFAALWAISNLSIDRAESLKTLAAAIVTLVCLTELIRWQTIRRLAPQKEVWSQARLRAETPYSTQLSLALTGWLAQPPPESPAQVDAIASPQFDIIRERFGADTLDQAQVAELFEIAGAEDVAVVNDLIDGFLTGVETRIAAIRLAIEYGERGVLVSEAHSLAGSSGSYGASQLSAIARQLETLARRANPEAAGELLAQLEAEFERVKCAFAMLQQSEEA
jgi:HPt (histidine-containing phosphotransfer) domain-containing protein